MVLATIVIDVVALSFICIVVADLSTGMLDSVGLLFGPLAVLAALPAFFAGMRRLRSSGRPLALWNTAAGLLGIALGSSLFVLTVQKVREEAGRLH